jgi:hypothetical protein
MHALKMSKGEMEIHRLRLRYIATHPNLINNGKLATPEEESILDKCRMQLVVDKRRNAVPRRCVCSRSVREKLFGGAWHQCQTHTTVGSWNTLPLA